MLSLVAIKWFIIVNFTRLVMNRIRKTVMVLDDKAGRLKVAENALAGEFQDTEYVFFKLVNKGNDRTGKMIIAMALPNPDASVEAYLVIPRNHGKAVVLMNDIVAGCTDNIYVSILTADLDSASELIENYNKAHGEARKVTLNLAVEALEVFMAAFQAFANQPANKKNSIVILQSGNFHVKGIGGNHPDIWDAFQSSIAGEVLATAIKGEGNVCYDWWISFDNIIWIRMDPTVHNRASFSGLNPHPSVWVKYQLVEADGPQGFHPAIKVQVPA